MNNIYTDTISGMQTNASSLEEAEKNIKRNKIAKIKREEKKLTEKEEAIILLALNWYCEYGFDSCDEERGLTAEAVNDFMFSIRTKLKLKTKWADIMDLDFNINK